MTNPGKMCEHTIIRDVLIDQILECSTPEQSNQKMLDIMILIIKDDSDLLEFCKVMEGVPGNLPTVIGPLRFGGYKI